MVREKVCVNGGSREACRAWKTGKICHRFHRQSSHKNRMNERTSERAKERNPPHPLSSPTTPYRRRRVASLLSLLPLFPPFPLTTLHAVIVHRSLGSSRCIVIRNNDFIKILEELGAPITDTNPHNICVLELVRKPTTFEDDDSLTVVNPRPQLLPPTCTSSQVFLHCPSGWRLRIFRLAIIRASPEIR